MPNESCKSPSSEVALNFSNPIVHSLFVASQINSLNPSMPALILIPASSAASVFVKLEFNSILASASLISSVLTVVVVPTTVRLPVIFTSPLVSISFTYKLATLFVVSPIS